MSASECCGIESVVALNTHYRHNVGTDTLRRLSFVDWCYFVDSNSRCDDIQPFKQSYWALWANPPANRPQIAAEGDPTADNYQLMLDTYHLDKYGLSEYRQNDNECRCQIESAAPDPDFVGPGCEGSGYFEIC